MAVSRRLFIAGLGVGIATAATPSTASGRTLAAGYAAGDVSPVEHFRQMRRVLIDNDNLFGPNRVLLTVQEQISFIHQLRQNYRGADQRELLCLQTQFAELSGWLHQDSGDQRAALHWLDRSLGWAQMADDAETSAYVMARKSQLAGDMREPTEAIDAAEAALAMAPPRSKVAAIAAIYGAHGHAIRRDELSAERGYERAQKLLDQADHDPESPWGGFLDAAYLDAHRASSFEVLGEHRRAVRAFQTAITQLPGGFHRDRGVYRARQAIAHVGGSDIEQATEAGYEALAIGAGTGSGRIFTELGALDQALVRWGDVVSVQQFREALGNAIPHQA